MTTQKTIPVFRIFDYEKAIEFYVEWLGFTVNFEHRFEENMPVYLEIQNGDFYLHLSEHHGDSTPGSSVFVWCDGVADYHLEIMAKNYKFNRPGLEETFYGALSFNVIDPFGNRISFNEKINSDE